MIRDQILKALGEVGIQKGDVIFVHSDAGAAIGQGNIFNLQGTLQEIVDAFVEAVGSQGTFIVPTFNFDFCKGRSYSHETSPSQVGLLSNYVLFNDRRSVRSFHPIFSVAAIGALAHEITGGLSKSSFGEGSIFHRLHQVNAKLVDFNLSFYYCTFIHYVEQKIGIDYRFLKHFTGTVSIGEREYTDTFDFYARYLDRDIVLDLTRLEKELTADGRIKKTPTTCPYSIIQASFADIFDEAVHRVKKDPYYLLKQPPTVPKN